jgi:hypothetical protein
LSNVEFPTCGATVSPYEFSVHKDEHNDESTTACLHAPAEYTRQINPTQILHRAMILRELTFTPISVTVTAANERAGTFESFDATDFDDF